MTLKRSLHSAIIDDKFMYVFGGSSNKSADMNIYSFVERRWETHPPSGEHPGCLWGHSAISWNGCMFVFGGCDQEGKTTNQLYCFSLATKEWKQVRVQGEMPPSRSGHSAVLLPQSNSMLVFGGEHQPNQPLLNDIWMFDFASCNWQKTQVTGLAPRGRKHHTAVEYEDRLYVFGGTDSRATFNDFYIFDIKGKQWHAHEGAGFPPTERFGHVAVVHNRRMHVFGGLETVQMYSNGMGIPVTYPFLASASGGGLPTSSGPTQPKASSIYFLNDWYKFSFKYGTWIRLSPNGHIPSGRWGHTATEHEGKLYVLGGANHKGCLNDMYDISLSSLSNNVLSEMASGKLVSCASDVHADQWNTSIDHQVRGEKRQLGLVYDESEGEGGEDGAMDMDNREPTKASPPRRSLHVKKG